MFKKISESIMDEVKKSINTLDEKSVEKLKQLLKKKTVFITAMGRSLLVGKAFAMRLVQLGLRAHVIGEPTTPAINKRNLLLAISGSGETEFTKYAVDAAKKAGSKVIVITGEKDSPITKKADMVIQMESKTKFERGGMPLGTVFEIGTLVFLDSIIIRLKKEMNVKEDDMLKRHNVIE